MNPVKPFETYKWRWLSVAPTESLLEPPVLLGVLRVLARHEGEAPSAPQIIEELKIVQDDTGLSQRAQPVILSRTGERNLIRNSGQYWKGTGLLAPVRGEIQLTPLGHQVASGAITQGEFAAIMIQQTVLPNPWTYPEDELAKWKAADLEIRPFVLILEIINELGKNYGGIKAAYLSPRELILVVIPLAGEKTHHAIIAQQVSQFREGLLDVQQWPDCAPRANDKRFAREFLLFLSNFGVCRRERVGKEERYYLDDLYDVESASPEITSSIFTGDQNQILVMDDIRHSALPSIIERQRTTTTVLKRPNQAKFRNATFKAYSKKCYITGEEISEVLEAAHIIPVEHGGADTIDNSLCLRVDIHRLFDSGIIRLKPSGDLLFMQAIADSKNYSLLPSKIEIPKFVNPANVQWRDSYY